MIKFKTNGNKNKNGELKPLTEYDLSLMNKDTISSQLPVVFKNGNKIAKIKSECRNCGSDDDIHGTITNQADNVMVFETASICHQCKTVDIIRYRIYDDYRIVLFDSGKWKTFMPKKKYIKFLFSKLKKFLF